MSISLEYFPENSLVHRIEPRLKIIYTILITNFIFFAKNLFTYVLIALFTFIMVQLSKVSLSYITKSIKPIISFLAVTSLLNLFFIRGTPIARFYFLTISKEGVIFCLVSITRMSLLMFNTNLLALTTPILDISYAIEKLLAPLKFFKFPVSEFTMIITISIRFIPTIVKEIEKIMKAQMARGVNFQDKNFKKRIKNFTSILIPLFVSSFSRAEELANAMESRCYDPDKPRTRYKETSFKSLDLKMSIIYIIFFISVIISEKFASFKIF